MVCRPCARQTIKRPSKPPPLPLGVILAPLPVIVRIKVQDVYVRTGSPALFSGLVCHCPSRFPWAGASSRTTHRPRVGIWKQKQGAQTTGPVADTPPSLTTRAVLSEPGVIGVVPGTDPGRRDLKTGSEPGKSWRKSPGFGFLREITWNV